MSDALKSGNVLVMNGSHSANVATSGLVSGTPSLALFYSILAASF